jgi:cytochrome c oxidase subunit I
VPEAASIPYDAHGIHMPGQSWYPLLAAVAMLPMSYGLLYNNWWVLGLSLFVIVVATYLWALEGVGGKHIHVDPDHPHGADRHEEDAA